MAVGRAGGKVRTARDRQQGTDDRAEPPIVGERTATLPFLEGRSARTESHSAPSWVASALPPDVQPVRPGGLPRARAGPGASLTGPASGADTRAAGGVRPRPSGGCGRLPKSTPPGLSSEHAAAC